MKKGTFGYLLVSLPTKYEGGEVEVTLGPEKVAYSISEGSSWSSFLIAFYGDASARVQPIKSGLYPSLVYALVHTSSEVPQPAGLNTSTQQAGLEAILRDWSRALTPALPSFTRLDLQKVAILLDRLFRGSSLEDVDGRDKIKVGVLRRAAKGCGFKIYIGNLTCKKEGATESCTCAEDAEARNDECEGRREEAYDSDDDPYDDYGHYGRWGGRRRDHYDRERRDDISEDEDVETACD